MKQQLISVIIAAYNVEKYIEKCIYSLLEQSYSSFELIIIDDGSTDTTGLLCDKMEKEDARIHVYHTRNNGVSEARNIGIKRAKGKYITFVDADDFVARDFLNVLSSGMGKGQLSIIDFYYVKEDRVYTNSKNRGNELQLTNIEALEKIYSSDLFQGYIWNKMFLREIINNENLEFNKNIKIWEDLLFCVAYLSKIEKVVYINSALYYYVQRSDSAMGNITNWHENTQNIAMREIMKYADQIKGNFLKKTKEVYANLLINSIVNKHNSKINDIEREKTITIVQNLKTRLGSKEYLKFLLLKYMPCSLNKLLKMKKAKGKQNEM